MYRSCSAGARPRDPYLGEGAVAIRIQALSKRLNLTTYFPRRCGWRATELGVKGSTLAHGRAAWMLSRALTKDSRSGPLPRARVHQ